ncbi:MAG: glycosyltransferase family 39 protein [Anaerolinea sp.]|nr:glycosyltransferase family 39 protein [Anaerolinea sp.]
MTEQLEREIDSPLFSFHLLGVTVSVTRTRRPRADRAGWLRWFDRTTLYLIIVAVLGVIILTQPAPISTGALVVMLAAALVIGAREFDVHVPRLRTPPILLAHRNKLAFVFAAISFGLMIAAALDYRTIHRQTLLDHATVKMLAGGLLLGVAVALSSRKPAFPALATNRLSETRKGWWIPALFGVVILFLLGEISAPRLGMLALKSVSINLQYALFMLALALLGWGFGGLPPLRLRQRLAGIDWRAALPLILVLIFAFGVRAFGLNDTLRSLMDELHFTDGVMRIHGTPDLRLLTGMSGQSPFTWVFTFNQYWASRIFGFELEGIRMTSVFAGVITVAFTYYLTKALFGDKRVALLSAFFLAAFAPYVHFSRSAIIQIADPLVGIMALTFAARALRHNRRIDWALAGVGLGLTQYFYEGGRLLFPVLMVVWIGALIVLQRRKLLPLVRGIVIMALVGVLIMIPYYYVLTGSSDTLLGRMDDSGLGSQYWENLLADGVDMRDVQRVAQQFVGSFRIYVAHRDLSAYYGGEQPLIVDYLVPFFLFGAFYLFWRMPSAAIIIPLWVLGTGFGNGLLRDTLVSSRYVIVLPALAVAIAAGMVYWLPFVWTRRADTLPPEEREEAVRSGQARRESRLRFAIPAALVIFFGVAQIHYYYFPHLAVFNRQIRDFKPYRDGIDVALRTLELPPQTQVYIISRPEHDQNVPRDLVGYMTLTQPLYPPMLSLDTAEFSPRYLLTLPADVGYAFFVEADDMDTMRLLMRYFPQIEPPSFTKTVQMPAHREYVMLYLAPTPDMPRAPIR